MKRHVKFLIVLMILIVAFAAFSGCGTSLKAGKAYHLYTYNVTSDRFVKLGSSIVFGKDFKTYTYVFSDGTLSIHGNVSHTETPNVYLFTCGADVNKVVKEKYREYLIETNADERLIELFNMMSEDFSSSMQLVYYNGYLFSLSSVELSHSPTDSNTGSFEGEFTMTKDGEKLKLRGNTAYTADENGNYTVYAGYYTVSNGIMTFTTVDEKGKDKYVDGLLYRKRYLMATITFPELFEIIGTDFEEQLEEAQFVKNINSQISAYSGKTIALLSDEFFACDMK